MFWQDVGCESQWTAFHACYAEIESASELVCTVTHAASAGVPFPDIANGVCRTELRQLQECGATRVLDTPLPVRQVEGLECDRTVTVAGHTGCTVDFQGSSFTYYLPTGTVNALHVITGPQQAPDAFDRSRANEAGTVDVYPGRADNTLDLAYTFAVVRRLQTQFSLPSTSPVWYTCYQNAGCGSLLNGYHPQYLKDAPGPVLSVWFTNATPTAASLGTAVRYPISFLYAELNTWQRWREVASVFHDDRSTEFGCDYTLAGSRNMWAFASRDIGPVERKYCNNAGPYRVAGKKVFGH